MRALPVSKELFDLVEAATPGTLFFPGDFMHLGSAEAIHTTFHRLAMVKDLERLAKGIYLKPVIDPELGPVRPSREQLARKIAERDQVIIRPTGSYALNKLGLSSQVPTKVVFLTNGNSKRIGTGRGQIIFKKASARQLAVKSEKVFLVIQALIALGDKAETQHVISQITAILENESLENIMEGAKLAPQRIGRILYKIADKIKQSHHG